MTLVGRAVVSANGRFILQYATGHLGAPGFPDTPGQVNLIDLVSGSTTLLGQSTVGDGQLVANNGTALVQVGSQTQLVEPSGTTAITPASPINNVQVAEDAGRIVYDTFRADGGIRVFDVATGVDRQVTPGSLPRLAEDGRRFSYLNANQVWLGDALSGPVAALTHEPEGIADQTITGDGTTVFAATYSGRLLSIDIASGKVTQLLDSTPPRYLTLGTTPVPGSYNWLMYTSDTSLQIRANGVPAILLGVQPGRLLMQVPWEVPPDPSAATVVWGREPVWELVVSLGVPSVTGVALPLDAAYDIAIHEDWSRLVTRNDPARAGEIIHVYGTGWGSVDGVVPSGQPTPADRLFQITAPCQWATTDLYNSPALPVEVLFAGLAPGLTGVYQLNLRIPPDWPYQTFIAACRTSSASYGTTAYPIPVAQ